MKYKELNLLKNPYNIYLDIEFNGMPNQEIINIGCFFSEYYSYEQEYISIIGWPLNLYIKPEAPVTSYVEELTGITNQQLDAVGVSKDRAIQRLFAYMNTIYKIYEKEEFAKEEERPKMQFVTWGKDDMKALKHWLGDKWKDFEDIFNPIFRNNDIGQYYNLQAHFSKNIRKLGYPEIEHHGQRSLIDAIELLSLQNVKILFEHADKRWKLEECIISNKEGNFSYHQAFKDALLTAAIDFVGMSIKVHEVYTFLDYGIARPDEFLQNMNNLTSLKFKKTKRKKQKKLSENFFKYFFSDFCSGELAKIQAINLDKTTIRLLKDGLPKLANTIEDVLEKKLSKSNSEDVMLRCCFIGSDIGNTGNIRNLDYTIKILVESRETQRIVILTTYGEWKVFKKILIAMRSNPKNKKAEIYIY